MLKRKKNVIILISVAVLLMTVLLIVAVGLCMIYKSTKSKNYVNNVVTRYNDLIFANYGNLIGTYGKPQNEYAATHGARECWVVCYYGATAVYEYNSEEHKKYDLLNAVISSDNFWKGESFIGWEQSKIEEKFKYSCRATRPQLKETYFNDGSKMEYEIDPYYDDEYISGIGFIYDEDNIVEKVVLTCGLP